MGKFHENFIFSFHYSLSYKLFHLLVCKSKNFGSWVYQLMIQFIVLSSFLLQDYISFIFFLVFFCSVFIFGVVVFLSKGYFLSVQDYQKFIYFLLFFYSIGILLKYYGYLSF